MFCESGHRLKMTVSVKTVLRLSQDLVWIGPLDTMSHTPESMECCCMYVKVRTCCTWRSWMRIRQWWSFCWTAARTCISVAAAASSVRTTKGRHAETPTVTSGSTSLHSPTMKG